MPILSSSERDEFEQPLPKACVVDAGNDDSVKVGEPLAVNEDAKLSEVEIRDAVGADRCEEVNVDVRVAHRSGNQRTQVHVPGTIGEESKAPRRLNIWNWPQQLLRLLRRRGGEVSDHW